MLKESGSGMSGGDAEDVGGGWGVSKESSKTGAGEREGNIEAQGSLRGIRAITNVSIFAESPGITTALPRNIPLIPTFATWAGSLST